MNFDSKNDEKKYHTIVEKKGFLVKTDMCDYIGFKPMSVRIKEMKAKGELTELMSALENNNLTYNSLFAPDGDDVDKPISLLNIKNLDKVELQRALISRYKSFQEKMSAYKDSLDSFKGRKQDVESEPPQAASDTSSE